MLHTHLPTADASRPLTDRSENLLPPSQPACLFLFVCPTRFFGEELTWNLRDAHFLETVKALDSHLSRRVEMPKLVLW